MSEVHLVIHISQRDIKAIQKNIDIAKGEGADGVFIISHDGGYQFTMSALAYYYKTKALDGLKVGVNFLDLKPENGFKRLHRMFNGELVSTLWTDEPAKHIVKPGKGNVAYWPGVAFKYRKKPRNLVDAVTEASEHADVLVTSGDGTGIPPTLEKIMTIKKASSKPIAIASGITPENVTPFIPYADYFMVATGVSTDFLNFNRDKVKALIRAVKG